MNKTASILFCMCLMLGTVLSQQSVHHLVPIHHKSLIVQRGRMDPVKRRLHKRNVDFSDFDWIKTLDGLYSPDTFVDQIVVGASLTTFRTAGFLIAQWIYCKLLDASVGSSRTALESLDYLFNTDAFVGSIGRNFRNYSLILLGRSIFDLVVYGPIRTIQGLTRRSFPEVLGIAFSDDITQVFYGRFVIEGISVAAGWLLWGVIGNINEATLRRKRRSAQEEGQRLDEPDIKVPEYLTKGLERVMMSLYDDSTDFF
ncbi:hypothetical protein TCAL_14856 [Tigriopus californicus]|uniref:Uncharacterized protein n=1 Tax=Tigriopus californicus TaxID=6832 RepID=A0A553P2I4_TIGCA|nr:uncharacterized protein LOC131884212 [Tigriopus californicus]XP_059087894.1 uncharacterized protein LOC131884212 [Tigriopus californicus]XP_059087895.1 uncharacterized protein LOC131884212 [Tigriopus californicus]TRY71896.1 hypothetical protein TCAL_14856 [Tigriopus californicus]